MLYTDLPSEVWAQVALHLTCEDIVNFADLDVEIFHAIQSSHELSGLHAWDTHAESKKHKFPLHVLLLDILHETICADCIRSFDVDEEVRLVRSDGPEAKKYTKIFVDPLRHVAPPILNAMEKSLLKTAVAASPWIFESEREVYLTDILLGDEDSLLCVLLPLLRQLQMFCVPINIERLAEVVTRISIAKETLKQQSVEVVESQDHSLTQVGLNMRFVWSKAYNGNDWGIRLGLMAPFISLPTVRRLVVFGCRDEECVPWPVNLPKSMVKEVFLIHSSVSRKCIEEFAKGFQGPCHMVHGFNGDSNCDTWGATYEWSRCVVDGRNAPKITLGPEPATPMWDSKNEMPEMALYYDGEILDWQKV